MASNSNQERDAGDERCSYEGQGKGGRKPNHVSKALEA